MYQFERNNPIVITDFKWAGKLGPIEIKSPCNECDVITNMLTKMIDEDLKGKNAVLEVKPWLNNIFYCLARGAWHAPIIIVNGKKFFFWSDTVSNRKLAIKFRNINDGILKFSG